MIKNLFFILFLLISYSSFSQVSGLSYTLSPTVEYNWFNTTSGIGNGYLAGGQFGFGFGEYVELRANYQKGFNLQTDINNFGLENSAGLDSLYVKRDINLTRYGGEVKLNLSRGALLPYITLGTGIQNLEADSLGNHKQIYLTTGLGIKFSAANRYTIGIQALRTGYRANSISTLMDANERDNYGLATTDFTNVNITNYALRASLVLYLGGRKPGVANDVDNAYFDNFSGGFRGLSIPIEPTVMKINFHEDLAFRSTWMAGGSAGINVGPLIGVRGFYWKALQDETTNFDDLAMYGGEARFKLNDGKGLTPWITLGGGQINVGDDYVGSDSIIVEDKAFAMGGFGLDLPFTKYFKATGYARSILTSTQTSDQISMPEDLKNSWSYGVSLNFILGKKPAKVEKVQKDALDSYLLSSQQGYDLATDQLKSEYDAKIMGLEKQLEVAILNQDVAAVKAISEQKDIAEQVRSTIANPANGQSQAPGLQAPVYRNGNSVIQMSPAEFQLLLRDILDATKGKGTSSIESNNASGNINDAIMNLKTEQKIADLEKEINELKTDSKSFTQVAAQLKSDNSEIASELKNLIREYNDKIYTLERELDSQKSELNDIDKNQSRIENGLNSKESMVSVESVGTKKLSSDIVATNARIDNLQRTILNSFRDLREDIELGEFDKNYTNEIGTSTDNNRPQTNKSKVAISSELAEKEGNFAHLKYTGMSGFAGFGVGGSATFNIGYRLHYAIDSTNFEFMPETFFGLGSPSSFGLMANLTYALPFLTKTELVKPYIGVGLGLMKVGDAQDADQLKGAYNFIVGSSLNVWKGDLYVDYTARNLFKYNQLIVGYRFPF